MKRDARREPRLFSFVPPSEATARLAGRIRRPERYAPPPRGARGGGGPRAPPAGGGGGGGGGGIRRPERYAPPRRVARRGRDRGSRRRAESCGQSYLGKLV